MSVELPYPGRKCPKGMVQVEFVGCGPADKISEYGWRPVASTFLEVWVDGRRFRIDVGDIQDGRRGIHIVSEIGIVIKQTACNSLDVGLP